MTNQCLPAAPWKCCVITALQGDLGRELQYPAIFCRIIVESLFLTMGTCKKKCECAGAGSARVSLWGAAKNSKKGRNNSLCLLQMAIGIWAFKGDWTVFISEETWNDFYAIKNTYLPVCNPLQNKQWAAHAQLNLFSSTLPVCLVDSTPVHQNVWRPEKPGEKLRWAFVPLVPF